MPIFHYRAVTGAGELKQGQMSAADQQAIVCQLQAEQLIPLEVDELGSESGVGSVTFKAKVQWQGFQSKLNNKHIIAFTQQLTALLSSGISLDRCLEIMRNISADIRMRDLIDDIQSAVRGGSPLSQALQQRPDLFNRFYISVIKASELTGELAQGLEDLSAYLERARQLRDRVISAVIYPCILLVVTLLSLVLILVYVVPQFAEMFDEMGAALPTSTRIVLAIAEIVQRYGVQLLLLVIGLVYLAHRQLQQDDSRLRWHRFCLRLPLFGSLLKKLDTARFSHSLSTLLKGGLPLLQALPLARDVMNNQVLLEDIRLATERLREGEGLSEPLIHTGVFPDLALQMIKVGEESGELESMLLRVSTVYEQEVNNAVQRLLTILEPLLIVGLGVIIGAIIMSILAAIMGINQLPV